MKRIRQKKHASLSTSDLKFCEKVDYIGFDSRTTTFGNIFILKFMKQRFSSMFNVKSKVMFQTCIKAYLCE
jgi:hypothetical protein